MASTRRAFAPASGAAQTTDVMSAAKSITDQLKANPDVSRIVSYWASGYQPSLASENRGLGLLLVYIDGNSLDGKNGVARKLIDEEGCDVIIPRGISQCPVHIDPVWLSKELGVPVKRLRITYVRAVRIQEPHMVLAYFATPDAEPVILDNINKTIQPASNRGDLVPVYSFNGSGLWLAKQQQGRGQSAGSSDRIGHWKDLQNRMKGAT